MIIKDYATVLCIWYNILYTAVFACAVSISEKKKLAVKQVGHVNSATASRVSSVLYLCTEVRSAVLDLISYCSSGPQGPLLISPTGDQRGMVVLETKLEAVKMMQAGKQQWLLSASQLCPINHSYHPDEQKQEQWKQLHNLFHRRQ